MRLHIAKDGDTIFALSRQYGVEPERIRAANPQLAAEGTLAKGAKVKIPTGPVAMKTAPAAELAAGRSEENAFASLAATAPPRAPESFAAARNDGAAGALAQAAEAAVTGGAAAAVEAGVSGLAQGGVQAAAAASVEAAVEGAVEAFAAGAGGPLPVAPSAGETAAITGWPNAELPFAPYPADAFANAQAAPNANIPAYYKTEMPEANASPMYVKWSGMGDEPAQHPYITLPTPAVPAGAPMWPMGPYGVTSMGVAGVQAPPAWPVPFGAMPEPMAPAFAPFSAPAAAPFGAPTAGDCGCGGGGAGIRLPYALPLRGGDAAGQERAFTSAIQGASPAAATASTVVEAAADAEQAQADNANAPSRSGKGSRQRKARVSSGTDALRAFLKRRGARRSASPRGSKPWIRD